MATEVRIHNIQTGGWETKKFSDEDKAFDYYWKLSDKDDPDLEVELITKA
jgi:hypothetical protein